MTAQPDHATEARRLMSAITTRDWAEESPYVDRRTAAAQVHALLAIHEQLADIAQRLPRPVVNDLRAEVQPPAHPGGFMPEPEVAIRGGRLTRIADELRFQVIDMRRPASPDREDGR